MRFAVYSLGVVLRFYPGTNPFLVRPFLDFREQYVCGSLDKGKVFPVSQIAYCIDVTLHLIPMETQFITKS